MFSVSSGATGVQPSAKLHWAGPGKTNSSPLSLSDLHTPSKQLPPRMEQLAAVGAKFCWCKAKLMHCWEFFRNEALVGGGADSFSGIIPRSLHGIPDPLSLSSSTEAPLPWCMVIVFFCPDIFIFMYPQPAAAGSREVLNVRL